MLRDVSSVSFFFFPKMFSIYPECPLPFNGLGVGKWHPPATHSPTAHTQTHTEFLPVSLIMAALSHFTSLTVPELSSEALCH